MHKKAFLLGGFTFPRAGPLDTLPGLQDSPMRVKRFHKHALAFALCMVILSLWTVTALAAPASPTRERLSLNEDWRFTKGDPAGVGSQLSYPVLKEWLKLSAQSFTKATHSLPSGTKPGEQVAYVRPDFDDRSWRALNLPHDWAVEGPFDQSLPGETAKLPYDGVGWYRKTFTLPASDQGRQIYLDVDGAMSFAAVWLNGKFVGGWPYGYSSWRVDLTPFAHIGGTNVLAIRLDNPPMSSRWYPGAGIYRNVWLVKTAPIHVAQWGTKISFAEQGSTATATSNDVVHVRTTLENRSGAAGQVEVETALLDPRGREVARIRSPVTVAAGETTTEQSFAIRQPQRWSVDSPKLYTATTRILVNGKVTDEVQTPFGLRTIQFTATNGFLLNGERVPIKGVCLHHDFGALGAAFNLRAAERQLELMRDLGANAIRSSHNPAAPELLDLCDRMGFLVMEEAFDAWRMTKRTNDYSILFDDWHEADLRAMIRRDYNHPSIILWSLGNEVYEQREGTNAWLAEKLAAIAHDEDSTRPVNMALHVVAASTNGFQKALDVFGYNYTPFGYAAFRSNNPTLPLIGSETTSTVSSRGEYYFPASTNRKDGRMDFQATSYDYAAPSWAYMPDTEFKALDENPFVVGEFVWTGIDYLGEPTPYDTDTRNRLLFSDPKKQAEMDAVLAAGKKIPVPSRSSYFGIMDLCGFPKDRFYLYQARWRPELPMAHILPHWNWPERIGQVTPVYVYTSGDAAELFLNGKSLGRKTRGAREYRLRWNDVVYQPGELKVVAYQNGKRWATDTMKTAGPAARIDLSADRTRIQADGEDLSFITVTITDKAGLLVPRSRNRVRFRLEGPGEIVATDNGDPISHEPFQQHHRAAFNGMCLVVVRSRAEAPGAIQLKAESDALKGAEVTIRSK
jgi:beta-galactosidase